MFSFLTSSDPDVILRTHFSVIGIRNKNNKTIVIIKTWNECKEWLRMREKDGNLWLFGRIGRKELMICGNGKKRGEKERKGAC